VRVFAFEFFSGGGLAGRPLPPSLAREGDLILTTLVGELAEIPGVEVIASRDPRLPAIRRCETLRPELGEDPFALYARGLAVADSGWPCASEESGTLERLSRETLAAGRILLGCRPDAVRLAASKRATAGALRARGIFAVPTFAISDPLPPLPGPWVVKPDDGAGCDGAELLPDWGTARERLDADPGRLVAQPWIEGEALSLSLLCAGGSARLLSCNRQWIGIHGCRITLEGITVNDREDRDGGFARLAERTAATLPGLWGYVGVDLILGRDGPVVLEINPRLTTSYCGLPAALGCNTAALVLGLVGAGVAPSDTGTIGSGVAAEIRLALSHVS
jgi:predicted ATP-grasp superfamily ATP-dependent carboligase